MKTSDNAEMAKRCVNCGRYFRPDRRVGKRQRTCGPQCSHQFKLKRDRAWRKKEKGYFSVESRTGVTCERRTNQRVQIDPPEPAIPAPAGAGVRLLLCGKKLRVEIPLGMRVTWASAVVGHSPPGG